MPITEWRCNWIECTLEPFTAKMTMEDIEDGFRPQCPQCGRSATVTRLLSTFGGKFGDTPNYHRTS